MPNVLSNLNINKKLKNWSVVQNWTEIVGHKIAEHAMAIGVDAKTLYVEVDSPMWKSQLFLMKGNLIEKCKTYNVFIKDIVFTIADHGKKENA
jgi:predicted nucleic acid-binding Zn ribbon protein